MSWHVTDDVETYLEHVRAALEADPVRHTVPLSILYRLQTLGGSTAEPAALCWSDDGGIALMTPPFALYVATLPPGSGAGLVAALADRTVPEVNGDEAALAELLPAFGRPGTTMLRQRLYRLHTLDRPDAPGSPRPAHTDDLSLVRSWWGDFMAEAMPHEAPADARSRIQNDIADGRLWLWGVDEPGGAAPSRGDPVAMASRNPVLAGVSRVGPVWTPPEQRRRGFGAAVTAACTASALAAGAEHVVLFTDLANPTSDGIYRQIGFRPVNDRRVVRLG